MIRSFALTFLFLCCTPATPLAQYMFLDANGDGQNDGKDLRLPHSDWSDVAIWLDTTLHRDANLTPISEITEFEVVLQASALHMIWEEFRPARKEMRVTGKPLQESFAYSFKVECSPPLRPGRVKLGSVRFRPRWGTSLDIVPCRRIGRDLVRTSFRGPALFRLGPTVESVSSLHVVPGEWQDTDGVSFSERPLPSAGPEVAWRGTLYLGWHRMNPPFELRIVDGQPVVNGFSLYDLSSQSPEKDEEFPVVSGWNRARYNAGVASRAVASVLRGLGRPEPEVMQGAADAFRHHREVDSVRVERGSIRVAYRSGHPGFVLWSSRSDSGSPDPASSMRETLDAWRRPLESGYWVRIESLGSGTIVPAWPPLEAALERLRRGQKLSPEDSTQIRSVERDVMQWESIARPEPLHRVRP